MPTIATTYYIKKFSAPACSKSTCFCIFIWFLTIVGPMFLSYSNNSMESCLFLINTIRFTLS